MPAARADMGTKEWLVMPGEVFISSKNGLRSVARNMMSARPQPRQPSARYAATTRRWSLTAAGCSVQAMQDLVGKLREALHCDPLGDFTLYLVMWKRKFLSLLADYESIFQKSKKCFLNL